LLAGSVKEQNATALVTELFSSWYLFLVRYALRDTGSFDMAEDLAQETFYELYKSLRSGKTIDYPKAWTLCVLKREMNRRLKDRSRYDPLDEMDFAGGVTPEFSVVDDLQSLLHVLTRREGEVLLLRLESLKYREIADQLGISINSVNTLLSRALKKLQLATGSPNLRKSLKEKSHVSEVAPTP
jgi:RNA polymerase sigma factor (sigma-70 family)